LKKLQKNKDVLEKIIRESASLIRITYASLLSEGFTPDQALDIVKARGWSLGG
jgi:hypothetical protein